MNNAAASQFSQYGAFIPQQLEAESQGASIIKPPYFPRQRMKLNVAAILISIFAPWILFCLLFADVSFRIHYKMPALCWGLVALGFLAVLGIGALAAVNIMDMVKGSAKYTPSWYVFLFLTSLVAVVLGPVLGNMNFWQNMQPYYDLQNLNDYQDVDPTRMRGQQMMDAGRVAFLKGTHVDVGRAYAFQNLDTYCVAPITVYNPAMGALTPLTSYDFWAVGTNCCGGNATNAVNFKCGPYASNTASEGVRLVADEQRAFFRLAVQQAESAHMIKAVHPLFFHWSTDALGDMNKYLENAFKMFASWMIGFFVVQLGLVVILSYVLSKMGFNAV